MTNTFSVDIGIKIDIANTFINTTHIGIDSVFNANDVGVFFGNSTSNVEITTSSDVPQIKISNSSANIVINSQTISKGLGNAPKFTFFTSNGTFVPNTNAKLTKVTLIGGGGGTANSGNGSASTISVVIGGAAGGYVEIIANGSFTSNQDVIVGLGGNKINGTSTTFGNSTVNASANGGLHGILTLTATNTINAISANNSLTNFDWYSSNSAAYPHSIFHIRPSSPRIGMILNGNNAHGGKGGETKLGGGGIPGWANSTGGIHFNAYDGLTFGAGAGGPVSNTTLQGEGKSGANGLVIIEEYF